LMAVIAAHLGQTPQALNRPMLHLKRAGKVRSAGQCRRLRSTISPTSTPPSVRTAGRRWIRMRSGTRPSRSRRSSRTRPRFAGTRWRAHAAGTRRAPRASLRT
jgi:hypothetical protein